MRMTIDKIKAQIKPTDSVRYGERVITDKDLTPFGEFKSLKKIAFIDGGNAPIISSPGLNISFIRVYYTIYHKNRRIESDKSEFFCVARSEGKTNSSTIFFLKGFLEESLELEGDSCESIIDQTRRLAELMTAQYLLKKLDQGDTIVLDGSLRCSNENEQSEMDRLLSTGKDLEILISSIAKTCSLLTDDGQSLVQALRPHSGMWFMPIADDNVDAFIVKLNKLAYHVFRFEIQKGQSRLVSLDRLLGFIAANSTDPVFLGYPYGLIDADLFARVRNEEQDYLRVLFDYKPDVHSILDNIR